MQLNRFYSAMILIAGTSIGAAILSLPVSTAAYGFIPSALLLLVSWVFMTYSALLLYETNSHCDASANLIAMARTTLGWPGVIVAGASYWLLLYALMAAYLTGLSGILIDASQALFHYQLPALVCLLGLVLLLGALIWVGTRSLDILNRCLFLLLVVAFVIITATIVYARPQQSLLNIHQWQPWHAAGMVITSFGFAIIIPSLRRYCGQQALHLLPKAVIYGSLIPCIAYLIWEAVMLAEIPVDGPYGLLTILAHGQPATGMIHSLNMLLHKPWLNTSFRLFTLAIITTSLIGVTISLFDFLRDGLRISNQRCSRWLTIALTVLPPALFTQYYPQGFILALHYASFFVAILLGLLPTLMVWMIRRRPRPEGVYRTPGGPCLLIINSLFFIAVMIFEWQALT